MGSGILQRTSQAALISVLALIVAGCDENGQFSMGALSPEKESTSTTEASGTGTERDVEAPEVFQVTEAGLWDGRPSLGGVWVAHPDVEDPERVIIRNSANDKFVVGALFRRERDIPGPRLQISSDAAAALGMLAGAPSELNVTALRRETVKEEAPVVAEAAAVEAPDEISETSLDPISAAAAAIEASDPAAVDTAAAAPAAPPPPAPAPTPVKSSLAKPFIQIGIFSVEANADRTATQMRSAGMVPTVKEQSTNGKPFWRVLVGPASTKGELNELLKKIKAEGFSDAYAVTN
jgi:cell division septation protein DedD